MSFIEIAPKSSTIQITKFHIVGVRVKLYQSAEVSVDLFSDKIFVRNENLFMNTDEYMLWLNDDSYIVDFVLQKLGFEKKEPTPKEVSVEEDEKTE